MTTLKRIGFVAILCVLTSLSMNNETKAQSVGANSAVYLELGGNGLLYSLNYDYRFDKDWSARGGIMYAPVGDVSLTIVPLMANYLIGSNHNFEIGAGIAYLGVSVDVEGEDFAGISASGVAGTSTIGYRYQNMDGGFVFRIGLTPVFGEFGVLPWAGLSLGYAF